MACVTSGMIHTSGDVTLDMRTSALEPPLKSTDGGKGASPAGRPVRPELLTETDVLANVSVE